MTDLDLDFTPLNDLAPKKDEKASYYQPIETVYNGYHFRSRLEARWAVFFDALGVEYEYEPEGFKLSSGKCYLPDFKVKCYGTRGSVDEKPFDLWIEVKGKMTAEDANRIEEFAAPIYHAHNGTREVFNPTLIVGKIPSQGCSHDSWDTHSYEPMNECEIYPFNYELIDGDHFAAYPAAKKGKFYLWGDDGNYINNEDVPGVEHAYDLARQARFEHGEKPTI